MFSDYTFVPKKLISGIIENVDELYCYAHELENKVSSHLYNPAAGDLVVEYDKLLDKIDIVGMWIDLLK